MSALALLGLIGIVNENTHIDYVGSSAGPMYQLQNKVAGTASIY
jgi:hypothetical protein